MPNNLTFVLGLGTLVSMVLAAVVIGMALFINWNLFLTSFEVTNSTRDSIWVTPVGTWGRTDRRELLPQYYSKIIAFPRFTHKRHHVASNSTVHITYDYDDLGLSELLVEDASGVVKVLDVRTYSESHKTDPFTVDRIVIDSDTYLEDPSVGVRQASDSSIGTYTIILHVILVIPVILLSLWAYFRYRHRALPNRRIEPMR